MANPFMQYKQQSISTMSSGELIVTLFEEVCKDLRVACKMFDDDNIAAATVCTEKSKKIFNYLIVSLDFNYDISQNLYSLYNFFNQQIILSEVRLKSDAILEILPLIEDLKSTWADAQRLLHTKSPTQYGDNANVAQQV